jgi:hypothetical protein
MDDANVSINLMKRKDKSYFQTIAVLHSVIRHTQNTHSSQPHKKQNHLQNPNAFLYSPHQLPARSPILLPRPTFELLQTCSIISLFHTLEQTRDGKRYETWYVSKRSW